MAFPTTCWTILAEATLHGDEAGRDALTRMCESYRRPVVAGARLTPRWIRVGPYSGRSGDFPENARQPVGSDGFHRSRIARFTGVFARRQPPGRHLGGRLGSHRYGHLDDVLAAGLGLRDRHGTGVDAGRGFRRHGRCGSRPHCSRRTISFSASKRWLPDHRRVPTEGKARRSWKGHWEFEIGILISFTAIWRTLAKHPMGEDCSTRPPPAPAGCKGNSSVPM
jgi:hypothetical protein